MANSSSKGMTVGVLVLIALATVVFVRTFHHSPAGTATTDAATTAAPAVTPPQDADTKSAADTEPAADDTPAASDASSDLTAPVKQEGDDAAKEKAAPDEDKPADSSASSSGKASDGSLLSAPAALDIDIDKAMAERTLGRDDAAVSVIEYFSMTCPHCAHFSNDLLPEVKAKLVDTGKLKIIFRDYPLDTFAMKAAMMARCADPDKYVDLVEVLFKNQERWARSDDPVQGLIQLGSLAGMSPDFIKACMANEELQNAILKSVQDGQSKYHVNATPTFVFNSGAETMSGDKEVSDFVAAVNRLMKK